MHKIQLTYKNQPLNWPTADKVNFMFIEHSVERPQMK
jgi:hypothetical protein